ncbi:MAG: hypothetical protein AAFN30_03875, partial [Actinomycetota bacterium]
RRLLCLQGGELVEGAHCLQGGQLGGVDERPVASGEGNGRPQLAATVPLTGGYGSLVDTTELATLEAVSTFDELAALEAEQPAATLTATSHEFLLAFFDETAVDRASRRALRFGPPLYFWASRPEPSYDFDEPLVTMDVYQLTAIHGPDRRPIERRTVVARVERGADGAGRIVAVGP